MSQTIYRILWLLSCLYQAFGGDLYAIFDKIITVENFNDARNAIVCALFIFSLLTLLAHQFFIYNSLHDMEKKPDKWEKDFPNWFGTPFETFLRWSAFLMLLGGVGKILGMEKLCDTMLVCEIDFNPIQKTIVLSSCIFFAVLTIWNCFAGILSTNHNWKIDFLLSDLLAFGFWLVILLILLGVLKSVISIPLIITLGLYFVVILLRIFFPNLFIKNNNTSNANKSNNN